MRSVTARAATLQLLDVHGSRLAITQLALLVDAVHRGGQRAKPLTLCVDAQSSALQPQVDALQTQLASVGATLRFEPVSGDKDGQPRWLIHSQSIFLQNE